MLLSQVLPVRSGVGVIPEDLTAGMVYHGIQTETSFLRAHVAVLAQRLFVFERQEGVDAINTGQYRWVVGGYKDVHGWTAIGYVVPPGDLKTLSVITLPPEWFEGFKEHMDESISGRRAEKIVERCYELRMVPVRLKMTRQNDPAAQIAGRDFAGELADNSFEAKCDFRASEIAHQPRDRCTGRLFLQVWERNPRKKH